MAAELVAAATDLTRDLHVTSPLMAGPDVLRLQKRLAALGYDPGLQDGEYGPATASAVRSFQAARGLVPNGVVGLETRVALRSASVVPAAGGSPASTPGERALAEALAHVGEHEDPPGSNRTPFGRWFGVDGVPWCAIFASYCFGVGAGVVLAAGFDGVGCYANGCTYVPTVEAWLQATGQWVGRHVPTPGDLAIYNWDGRVPDHVGIVEEYRGKGRFTAIEGNTAAGDDANGGQVMRRLRDVGQVDGFGRIAARETALAGVHSGQPAG